MSDALEFMQQAEFYVTFNQASHWFLIVVEVADCSEFPSKALECLIKVVDEKKASDYPVGLNGFCRAFSVF